MVELIGTVDHYGRCLVVGTCESGAVGEIEPLGYVRVDSSCGSVALPVVISVAEDTVLIEVVGREVIPYLLASAVHAQRVLV